MTTLYSQRGYFDVKATSLLNELKLAGAIVGKAFPTDGGRGVGVMIDIPVKSPEKFVRTERFWLSCSKFKWKLTSYPGDETREMTLDQAIGRIKEALRRNG